MSAGEPRTSAKATALMPDLAAAGYSKADEFSAPLAQKGQDNYRTVWTKRANANQLALVDATVFEDVAVAKSAYQTVAAAWKSPPPNVVGGARSFVETPSPQVGQERKSYTTPGPDAAGNKIWTDVYRIGNVVLVIQVIDAAANEQMDLRQRLANEVSGKVR